MIYLMARYINIKYPELKIAIAVPGLTLAAKQQHLYCPWANKAFSNLFEDVNGIFVCIHDDLLKSKVLPDGTILFIDEIDSIFFDIKPKLQNKSLISPILILNRYKVIGLTATLRGN